MTREDVAMSRTIRISGDALEMAEAHAENLGLSVSGAVSDCIVGYRVLVSGACDGATLVRSFTGRMAVATANAASRRRVARRRRRVKG